ncbi:uncharacterized protein LOC120272206 [Dioscorea cayenensis subsp. rotundata]|uniref:Uncharacterized protein LOC120272206 n=1 Tax=Dioscorea cayennensis subsp. rotundata TaxID=55577 RepID=A0AB40C550_DIOCR|nr:uncharacterized protein LOC120272206 [Dioscorea cayenensis subsp. rotundata]
MEVSDQFSDSEYFKDALRNFAIKRNFNFTFIKNDKQRVTVKCVAEGCEWRVHGSMEGSHEMFRIKIIYPTHMVAVAKDVLHGSEVASYDLLMWYTKKVLLTNPGSVDIVENDGPRFKRVFFAFKACVIGFKTRCRPLLYLDGTHLLGKYGGTLLGATGKDGNDGFFHVAFAIIDNETDANWTWSKGIISAVAKVFPSSPYVYCLRHLEANFMKANVRLGKSLKERCWSILSRIMFSCAEKEVNDVVADLLNTSADAHQWLIQKSDLAHLVNYMFKGGRWGEMYSNVVESFNAWIKEARHLPVINMVDSIRFKLMGMLCHRREQSHRWERHLYLVIHQEIEELVEESRNLLFDRSDGDHFEVVDQKNYCISLNARACSCHSWQVYGIPYKHACAIILQTDTNIHRYVNNYFTVDSYRQAYAEAIFPVANNYKPDDVNLELLMRPPITKKPIGRPRRKRLESQASIVHKLRCSRCHDADDVSGIGFGMTTDASLVMSVDGFAPVDGDSFGFRESVWMSSTFFNFSSEEGADHF